MSEQATALPSFTISEHAGLWWLDRRCPYRGVAAQVFGPFRRRRRAAAYAIWMNRSNGHDQAGAAGEPGG